MLQLGAVVINLLLVFLCKLADLLLKNVHLLHFMDTLGQNNST